MENISKGTFKFGKGRRKRFSLTGVRSNFIVGEIQRQMDTGFPMSHVSVQESNQICVNHQISLFIKLNFQ